ncbi:hypothetical protein ZIOFF_026327 [Zingiber officinale]|uniref:GPI transamidase component PIG-S n=1 Tax=Zingiber officinale TaxID=94328 RepID=A0A8J5H3V9_ZINOF|nr:hypothetical protein ZIOFF_026327 [Zingiber officinale]
MLAFHGKIAISQHPREPFLPPPLPFRYPWTMRRIITLDPDVKFMCTLPFSWTMTEKLRSKLLFEELVLLSDICLSIYEVIFTGLQGTLLLVGDDNIIFSSLMGIGKWGDLKFLNSMETTLSLYYISFPSTARRRSIKRVHRETSGDERGEDALGGAPAKECAEASGGRVYTVVVVEREDDLGVRVVVGKHRHAWIVGKISENDVVSLIGKVFVKYFMNGGKKVGELAKGIGEFVPVGADGSVVLSFSLLNADPSDWVYDWKFKEMSNIMLTPFVKALTPIANISIESQVLYHTPKLSQSYWDEKSSSHIFSIRDLPFFVNSNEWHLDTSIIAAGRSKVLQFVVYAPSASECPLLLQLPNGEISMTNSFISPMWGGVIIWNPPHCAGDSHNTLPPQVRLSPIELQKIFQVFLAQLRMLFGLKSNYIDSSETGISKFLDSESGFTEWELDVLYRHHACFNLHSCVTTLESLAKLVQSLPRMIIMDEIGKQVKFSLEAANLAQRNASLGIYDSSASSSRQAKVLAEDAFFHPSIMSISYSSIEHYFAIYMPFFAPVALHVLLAAIKELKRYKRERAKYLAFISEKAKMD